MVTIPTYQSTSARWSEEVELDDTTYILYFYWNARDSAWYMDIYNSDDDLILAGIKLVLGYALLHQYAYLAGLPDGEFMVCDTNTDNPYSEDLDFDNFGDRYQLVYISKDEYES